MSNSRTTESTEVPVQDPSLTFPSSVLYRLNSELLKEGKISNKAKRFADRIHEQYLVNLTRGKAVTVTNSDAKEIGIYIATLRSEGIDVTKDVDQTANKHHRSVVAAKKKAPFVQDTPASSYLEDGDWEDSQLYAAWAANLAYQDSNDNGPPRAYRSSPFLVNKLLLSGHALKPEAMVQAETEGQVALHDNTTPLDGLRGLWNLGSTCYANAVWKMFANCDVFVSALVNFDTSRLAEAVLPPHSWQDNAKEFKEFAALLVQFYRDLVDLADPKPMRPTQLMDLARRLNPVFNADQQQDAAEFADFLFATLNVCLRIASGRNLPAGQISYRTLQRVQCECGYHNERLIPDKTMKIAIDPDIMSASEGNVTLMQLIRNEFRNTPTPEDFICPTCHLSNHATISRLLTTVPSYLFVHLKRFQHDDGEGRKVKEHIDFPIMALDILPVVHPSCRGQSSTTYDCISIVEHLGDNLEFGHYITKNRRYNSDDWVSHDDTKIREVPAGSIVTKDAYMLLYRQRTTPAGLQVLDERPAVFNPKPAMSKVQALKHKYEQAKRTADAGREKPTAIQARFELNEKKAKQAYEQALAEE